MPQLHCYVPEEIASQVHQKAEHAHMSVSKYLAQLVLKDVSGSWPENYFDLFGSWQGVAIKQAEATKLETREELQ